MFAVPPSRADASWPFVRSRDPSTTAYPRVASCAQTSRPIPRLAPVTTATGALSAITPSALGQRVHHGLEAARVEVVVVGADQPVLEAKDRDVVVGVLGAVGQHGTVAVLDADGVRIGCGVDGGQLRLELAEVREQALEAGDDLRLALDRAGEPLRRIGDDDLALLVPQLAPRADVLTVQQLVEAAHCRSVGFSSLRVVGSNECSPRIVVLRVRYDRPYAASGP